MFIAAAIFQLDTDLRLKLTKFKIELR